jgi:hypothetical protein
MRLNLEQVRVNVRQSATEDLLDRATIYREDMEVEALDIIERELRDRGVSRDQIDAHERKRRADVLLDSSGVPLMCHRCHRPAVGEGWGWHWLWGLLPMFPRRFAWCEEHRPKSKPPDPRASVS